MIAAGEPRPGAHRRLLETGALLLILALAAYLRLANLTDNPAWYTDEGTHLDIAQNLLEGRTRYLAIDRSTLLFAKLPLFEILLAGLLGVWPAGITTLRTLCGALGTLSVGGLYWIVRRMQPAEPWLATLSALMLAIHPQAVLYSRWGFSYNLLAPLVLVALLGLWEYLEGDPGAPDRRRWLALASLAVGVGSVSDLWMFTLILPVVLVVAFHHWRDLPWSLSLAALPFGLYAGLMLIRAPQPFLFDLGFTSLRLGRLSLGQQAEALALNYATLTLQDGWMALAMVGLFFLRPSRLRTLSLLLFLLPLTILGRTTALFSLGTYYLIPLWPLAGLGLAALIRYGGGTAIQSVRAGSTGWPGDRITGKLAPLGATLVISLLIATPLFTSTGLTARQVHRGFNTAVDPFLIVPGHARQVARFINDHAGADDLVIASPTLAWLLETNTADLQMSLASTGRATPDLPAGIPADRFAFDPTYGRARFVVVDNLWVTWGVSNVPGAADLLATVETWPLAFEAGEIRVYANPAVP